MITYYCYAILGGIITGIVTRDKTTKDNWKLDHIQSGAYIHIYTQEYI